MPNNHSWELPRANSIFDDARDALASLRGIRRRRGEMRSMTQDDALMDDGYHVLYINKEGQKVMKRVKNIVFGPLGRRALVGDDSSQEIK